MRTLVYHVATSLDHYIAHPDGTLDGFLMEGDFAADFAASIGSYGAVLIGRKTYESGYAFGLQKGQPTYMHLNPELMNYVFSNTLDFPPGDLIQIVWGDEAAFVRQLKGEPGKPIWLCGGGELAGRLLDAGLIDELVVKLNPIVLGMGIRLFGSSRTRARLALTDAKPYASGLVRLSYRLRYEG
jgi:dihydrofolate reductase